MKTNLIGPISLYHWHLMLNIKKGLADARKTNDVESVKAYSEVLEDCFDSFLPKEAA